MTSLRYDDDSAAAEWLGRLVESKADAPVSDYHSGAYFGGTQGNWVDGINQTVADGPMHLNVVVAICLGWLTRNFPTADMEVIEETSNGDGPSIPNHPFIALMNRPNPLDDFFSFCSSFLMSDVIDGNTFYIKIRNGRLGIHSLWWVAPWDVEVVPSRDNRTSAERPVIGYDVRLGGILHRYPAEDVIHIKDGRDPLNPYRGMAPLKAGERNKSTIDRADLYTQTLMRNCGAVSSMLSPSSPGGEISPKNVSSLQAQFVERTTGFNSGKPFISTQGIKLERLGLSPEEMVIDKLRDFPIAALCALIGTPAMAVGLPDPGKTYANLAQADRMAWTNGLIPRQSRFAEAMARQCGEMLGNRTRLKWNYTHVHAMQEDWLLRIDSLTKAAGKPIMSVNEAREKLNLRPVEGGDDLPEPTPPPPPPPPPPKDDRPRAAQDKPAGKSMEREDDDDPFSAKASDAEHGFAAKLLRKAAAKAGLSGPFRAGSLTAIQRRGILLVIAEMAESRLRREAESLATDMTTDMTTEDKGLSGYIRGKADEFFRRAAKILRTAYLAGALALFGSGKPLTAEADRVHQNEVRRQFDFLKSFRRDVLSGDQPPDGTLPARAEMYGASTWGVAQNTVAKSMPTDGAMARRIHIGGDKPCPDCSRLQAAGWLPIDEITPIGNTECGCRCHCHFEYADKPGNEVEVFPATQPDVSPLVRPTDKPKPNRRKPASKVVYEYEENREEIQRRLADIFGRPVREQELAGLAGVPNGQTVKVNIFKDMVSLVVHTKKIDMRRYVGKDDNGNPMLTNEHLFLKKTGTGLGVKIFGDQVDAAAAMGVKTIQTFAVRHEDVNGYYTWPRLGYDGAIRHDVVDKLPDSLKGATHVSELMRTPEGRSFWKENGRSTDMSFDLTEGSANRRVLDAYRAEKGLIKGLGFDDDVETKSGRPKYEQPPELSDDDERILDAIWDRIGSDSDG